VELALTPDETQCGPTWDLQDVEQYDGTLGVSLAWVQRHEGAVAYQVSPGCSGTMISDDLFISAGHCGYRVGDVIRFNYQDDPSGNPRATQDFTVATIVEQEDNVNWDYAIVRLNGNPGRIFGYARLANRDEDAGDNVVIIGHPNGVPKALHAGPILDYSSGLGTN
jgi:V8-like Glu-specific endopeptidase